MDGNEAIARRKADEVRVRARQGAPGASLTSSGVRRWCEQPFGTPVCRARRSTTCVDPPGIATTMRDLEDVTPGQPFGGRTRIRVKACATQFDPRLFHLDDVAASATIFGGVAAGAAAGRKPQ